jgi:hypothetical protein
LKVKNELKLDNYIKDEGCKILNEILLENKKIEKIKLSGKEFKKIIKGNNITNKGLIFLKESLKKNQFIKEIIFACKQL